MTVSFRAASYQPGRNGRNQTLAAIALALMIGASDHAVAQEEISDPVEPLNRAIFAFNETIDGLILDPAQQIYGYVVPEPAKRGVRNFLDNLRAPLVFIHDLLQGERERAGITLGRFMVNTTLGLGGIFDFASIVGMEPGHSEDFGQTLGAYGVGPGPYIVLPLLGPSSARDALGLAVDAFVLDPSAYVLSSDAALARRGVDAVDTRYRLDPALDDLEASSLDHYAGLRTVYLQRRAAEIRNGAAPVDDEAYEDIFNEDFEDIPDDN